VRYYFTYEFGRAESRYVPQLQAFHTDGTLSETISLSKPAEITAQEFAADDTPMYVMILPNGYGLYLYRNQSESILYLLYLMSDVIDEELGGFMFHDAGFEMSNGTMAQRLQSGNVRYAEVTIS